MNSLIPRIEAILFASSEPVSKEKLIKELKIERNVLYQIIELLKDKYLDEESGIQIIEVAEGYQMVTKPQYEDVLKSFYGDRRMSRLSRAALETLAIIAYKQPVTRQEIENIRGVNCDGVIKTLLDRELIVRRGQSDLPGKPSLYHTTKKFLSYFKLGSLSELPPISEFAVEDNKALFEEEESE